MPQTRQHALKLSYALLQHAANEQQKLQYPIFPKLEVAYLKMLSSLMYAHVYIKMIRDSIIPLVVAAARQQSHCPHPLCVTGDNLAGQ